MIYGIDALACAKYKDVIVKTLPAGWALGLFGSSVFGDSFSVAQALVNKASVIRVQLTWSDNHSYTKDHLALAIKEAKRYEALKGSARIMLSPYCEHNLKDLSFLDAVQKVAPSCTIVNTPMRGAMSTRYMNEVHGYDAKPPKTGPYNMSFDGQSCENSNIEAQKLRHKDAQIFFLWSARFNLKWSDNDTTPRPQRKALPDTDYMNSIIYLAGQKGATSAPKGWLVKSHSEKHNAADVKGDKLLVICPVKAQELTLKQGSKTVGSLYYYGPYSEGGYRYYSRIMGYKFGLVDVYVGSKKLATINGGFRDFVYR